MSLKSFLIIMTTIAVVSDTLLHPFYPQFFEEVFGLKDPKHVGIYFSVVCFGVMVAFPFWAYISKRVFALKILVYTQFIAGVLSLLCFWSTSLVEFWALSQTMILFKASYLLVYPFVMTLEEKDKQAGTIGLLTVIVHLGSISGALLGGVMVDLFDPRYIFFLMAAGDFLLLFISLYLLKRKDVQLLQPDNSNKEKSSTGAGNSSLIFKLGFITLIFYFSSFLIRPFFSLYWESISLFNSRTIAGAVFAIPGIVALIALWVNNRKRSRNTYSKVLPAILLGLVGLFLQASQLELLVLLGRVIYGWGIFQALVHFDVLLFELSNPSTYALDYSKIHFFQNLGVLISSFSAGVIVDYYGLQIPFFLAALGFLISGGLYFLVFNTDVKTLKQAVFK